MKFINIVFACSLVFSSVQASARLTVARQVMDPALKSIRSDVKNYSKDKYLGMAYIATAAGRYQDISDLDRDTLLKFVKESKLVSYSEDEGSIYKLTKLQIVEKQAEATKTAVEQTFNFLIENMDRTPVNGKLPKWAQETDELMSGLKYRSIRWALSGDNSDTSMIRTQVSVDADTYNGDGKFYRAMDGQLLIYVQPANKEFLVLLMGEQHD